MTSETKAYDGKHITNTLQGLSVQTSLLMGLDMEYKQKSTLNEHLKLFQDEMPDPKARPTMKFLVIGNGGHAISTNSNLATPIPLEHQPTDVAPYSIIPHALRPVDKDLSDEERKHYALRKKVEINGRWYWAYYLRICDWRGVRVKEWHTVVKDGNESTKEFEYGDKNLNPTPPEMPDYNYEVTDQMVPTDGDYVHSSAMTRIEFTENDVQEIQNVAAILYGDPTLAVVSEFGLVSAVLKETSGESATGSPFLYMEAYGAQVNIFMTTFVNVAFQNKGIAYNLDVGNTEPMVVAPGQVASQVGNNNAQLDALV